MLGVLFILYILEFYHIAFVLFVLFRCKCGNCSTEMLVSAKECYCCREIEKCVEFIEKLGSQTQNWSVDKEVICVTDHPAFPAVCLNIWSLELAADNYKTRDGYRYRQLGAKER